MKKDLISKFKSGMIRERVMFNRALGISTILLAIIVVVSSILICNYQEYILFLGLGIFVFAFVITFVVIGAKICKNEIKSQGEKLRKIVDEMVDQDEYSLSVMDYGFTLKVTSTGFVLDGETFGFDNFDIFLGTTNMYRQASVAFFIVSNFSPFSDERTYPINFGIEGNSMAFSCAKKYFFSADYKAFNYLIENPEESAKEILKYGVLKVQMEEQKREKKLEKLAKDMQNLG